MPSLSSLPSPLRAALGLAATVLDEARSLPDKAIELPMLAVSSALKLSLRAQQRYTALAARGDEVLSGRRIGDEPPAWATFDDVGTDDVGTDDVVTSDITTDVIADVTPDVPTDTDTDAGLEAAPARRRPAKTVRKPRTGAPSAFDSVADED